MLTFPLLDPTDVGYDIILAAGQSNMAGRGTPIDSARLDPADPRIFQYASTGAYLNSISLATEPLGHHDSPSGMGPALVFARWYAHSAPANRRILIVPVAHGATGFTTSSLASPPAGYTGSAGGNWRTDNADGGFSLYGYARTQAQAALTAAGPNSRIVAVLWHQGEADGTLTQAQYAAQLDALITGLRTLPTAGNATFVLGQMLPDNSNNHGSVIEKAHIDTARRTLLTAFAYGQTGYAQSDGNTPPVHYNAAGQRLLGRSFFDAWQLAKANVLGTAPQAPTAVVLTQSGTSINVTWARPTARFTDFTVQYRITGAGSWTTLTRTVPNLDNSATITGLTAGTSYDVRVTSTNEQGTSAASAIATLPMIYAPNPVTALTAGTTTASTIPLSWTAPATDGTHAAPAAYLVEYQPSGGSFATFGTVTGTSTTLTGMAPATAYTLRVTAQNAGGNATAVTTTATTATAVPLLTAMGVSAYQAYGLRKLNSSYAGSAVLVRRSSDSTTQAVGFTANGDLDQASLLTFCGAGSGYIQTWYDQSGNARDITQATAANQAQIVNAGVVTKVNGLPAALFNGTSTVYTLGAAGLYAAGAASMLAVAQAASFTAINAICGEGNSASGSGRWLPYYVQQTNGSPAALIRDDASASVAGPQGSSPTTANTAFQGTTVDTGTTLAVFLNGTADPAAATYTRAGHTLTLNQFAIGGQPGGGGTSFYFNGYIAEIALIASAVSGAAQTAGQANQKSYFVTP